ncbi:MAG TPA: hypothetical protein H9671_00380 [Firmicutes bacterium]|nr:hypothetical protein [Bacillota bacterium]
MTAAALCEMLNLIPLAGMEGKNKEVTGGYIGDLLSWVMGRCKEGDAWITVMGNRNAVAVALLRDVSCIILCEDAELDADARTKADEEGIFIVRSSLPAYELAIRLSALLK